MKLISDAESATLLRCSERTVRRLRREGKLPYIKVGRRVSLDQEDVEKFIERTKQWNRDSKTAKALSMSRGTTAKSDTQDDRAFVQKMRRKLRSGSRSG